MEEIKEEKKGFLKKMFSVFKKKAGDKNDETDRKKEPDEPIVKNERRVVNLADRTSEKAAIRMGERKESGMKKCPNCGYDLSNGNNVRLRSRHSKSRFADEDDEDSERTYQSCRLMPGNNLFPDSLTLSCDGISFKEGSLLDSKAKRISYRDVTSVGVRKGILFYNVRIDSRRSQPILLDGLWEDEAKEIKNTIRSFQGKRDFDDET